MNKRIYDSVKSKRFFLFIVTSHKMAVLRCDNVGDDVMNEN